MVAFVMLGPERRKPSVADRSSTTIENAPAERPLDGRNVLAEPAIDAVAFVGAAGVTGTGVGGGGATAPTVKLPFICDECGSHWKKYVPSVSVTVAVWSPTNATSVADSRARAGEVEVVKRRMVVDDERVGARIEVLDLGARRVRERDREGVVQAHVAGEHGVVGAHCARGADEQYASTENGGDDGGESHAETVRDALGIGLGRLQASRGARRRTARRAARGSRRGPVPRLRR